MDAECTGTLLGTLQIELEAFIVHPQRMRYLLSNMMHG
jgi:hypothetical protein